MEEFLKIKWGIEGPHELEHGPEFIPEEKIYDSYVYKHLKTPILKRKDDKHSPPAKVKKVSVPGANCTFKCARKSCLSKFQQRNCLTAITLLHTSKKALTFFEQKCIHMYNNLKPRILKENIQYLEFVKEQYEQYQKRSPKMNCKYKRHAITAWQEKFTRCLNYAQFYKELDVLSYSYDESSIPIEMTQAANLLELGSLAKFNPPSLVNTYILNAGLLHRSDILFNSKLHVSEDANIAKLLETNDVDVVISSSALKRLMDFTDLNCSWDIPVVVKTVKTSENSLNEKIVVFVDKPLPKRQPNLGDLNEYCVKKLLKRNFCNVEAFSFPNQEALLVKNDRVEKKEQVTDKNETETNGCNDSGERKLISYSDLDEAFVVGSPEKQAASDKEIDLCSETSGKNSTSGPRNSICHNVSYRIWNLHQQTDESGLPQMKHSLKVVKVLVRCKLDGCEASDNGMLQPTTVVPKLEYQLCYGGSIATKSELIKQWTAAFIRPFSQVYRVRTHFNSGEVIMVESCNIQKINNEAQLNYKYKPRLGLGVLYKIFVELMNVGTGNYLLHHVPKQGPFVALLKETEETSSNVYDLHEEYDVKNWQPIYKIQNSWCPIDVNLILPRHRAFNEMPGMFKPCENFAVFGKTKKGKKKKKTKNN